MLRRAERRASPTPIVVRRAGGRVVVAPSRWSSSTDAVEGAATFPRLVVEPARTAEVTVVERFVSDDVRRPRRPGGRAARRPSGPGALPRRQRARARGCGRSAQPGGPRRAGLAPRCWPRWPSAATTPACAPTPASSGRAPPATRSPCTSARATRCTTSAPCRTTPRRRPRATCCSRARCEGHARSVYTGLIRVRKERQGHQRLPDQPQHQAVRAAPGPRACRTSRSRPTTCAAATPRTVGPIDEEQRFYLESRGVPPADRRAPRSCWASSTRCSSGCRPRCAGARARWPPGGGQARPEGSAMSRGRARLRPGRRARAGHGPPLRGRAASTRSPSCACGDDVYAIGDTAATPNVSLSEGEVLCDELEIECWKHGSTFSLDDGEPQTLPATSRCRSTRSRVDGDDVVGGSSREVPRDDARDRGLRAGVGGKEILKGIDLTVVVRRGPRRHGPERGRASPRCRHVIMGRPGYEVLGGTVTLDGVDVLALAPWERAAARPVPGHAVPHRGARRGARRGAGARRSPPRGRSTTRPAQPGWSPRPARIGFDDRFLHRPLNVDLSGGEKKRNETLQLAVLEPAIAILDELDSGLDIDALRACARRVEDATEETGLGVLAITHYNRLLHELRADHVHILVRGPDRRLGRAGAGRGARARRLRGIRARGGCRRAGGVGVAGHGSVRRPPGVMS